MNNLSNLKVVIVTFLTDKKTLRVKLPNFLKSGARMEPTGCRNLTEIRKISKTLNTKTQ